jgi:hypothetical protein
MRSHLGITGLVTGLALVGCSGRIDLAALPDGGSGRDATPQGSVEAGGDSATLIDAHASRDSGTSGDSGASRDSGGGCATLGYGSPPAFPAGDGGACMAAVGGTASPECDPSDEQACGSTIHNGCAISPQCTAGNAACEAFTKNTGTVDNFRIRLLELTAPPKLASGGFIQTNVITSAVDLPNTTASCGENGSGLLNWLLSVDTVAKTVKTGGAPFSSDPFGTGYCFFNGTIGSSQVVPETLQASFTCSTFSTTPLAGTLSIPIFQNPTDQTDVIVLPITGAFFSDVTVSNDGNCIGSVNNGALSPGGCIASTPSGDNSCSRWHTAGAIGGYLRLADADNVTVTLLNESLCVLLTDDTNGAVPAKCTAAGLTDGDYCSTTQSPGGCKDSVWFSAGFAASAVNINSGAGVTGCGP